MSHDEHEGHYAWEVEPFDPEGPLGILISMSDVECGQILDVNTVILANGDSDEEIEWARSTAEEIAGRLNSIATLTAERDQLKEQLDGAHAIGFREGYRLAKKRGEAQRDALETFICLGHQGNPQQERCGGAWGYEEPNTWNSICVRAREALGGKS